MVIKSDKIKIIGICGPSKSGKSTLAESLAKKYKTDRIEFDHYLKPKNKISFKGRFRNWEFPLNYKSESLAKDLKNLKEGKTINHPIYRFRRGYVENHRIVKPHKLIFVEGFYLFINKKVRDLIDIKIFLNISKKEFFKRASFTEEKEEWTQREYAEKVIIPEYEKYGKKQKKYADFVISGKLTTEEIVNKIVKKLK